MTFFSKTRHKAQSTLFVAATLLLANTLQIDPVWADTAEETRPAPISQPAVNSGKKLILCLGGGGTRGAAHIGILRQLEKEHVRIDGIVGTSIGALIGGLYAAGLTPDEIEDVFFSKALIRAYLTVPILFRLVIAPVMYIPHAFGYHPYDGLYHGNKFCTFVNDRVRKLEPQRDNPDINIERLPIKYEAVCMDLLSGEPVVVDRGNLGRAVQASAAVPYLRRPVQMSKGTFERLAGRKCDANTPSYLLVDGGPCANLPTLQARAMADKMGNAFVLAVDTYGTFENFDTKHFRKIGSSAERSLEVLLSSVEKKDLDKADMVIAPETNGINLLSTKLSDARRAIEAGDKVGASSVKQLLKRLERR